MMLKLEPEKYEEHQAIFIGEIVEKIKIKLLEAGLEGEKVQELTASIAFSIASTIDDTSGIESNNIEVHPYLTFRSDDDELIHCGENSYTYEHVYGILNKLFND